MSRKSGFTLIELLVAATIFSIVSLGIYSVFQTGISSYKTVDSSFEAYQTARVILGRVELDLKNALAYTDSDSKFSGAGQKLDFITSLDFYSRDLSRTSVARVKYEFSDGKLKRLCYFGSDALKEEPAEENAQKSEYSIQDIAFSYAYATGKLEPFYDWREDWPKENDAAQKETFPLSVKIKLTLAQKNAPRRTQGQTIEFEKIVAMPLAKNTAKPSAPGGGNG
jgi:type II secretion system protein J